MLSVWQIPNKCISYEPEKMPHNKLDTNHILIHSYELNNNQKASENILKKLG